MAPGHLTFIYGLLCAPGKSIHRLLFLQGNLWDPNAKALAGRPTSLSVGSRWQSRLSQPSTVGLPLRCQGSQHVSLLPLAHTASQRPIQPLGGPWQSDYR